MMRSRTSWEVAEEAKENVFPESNAVSSVSPPAIMSFDLELRAGLAGAAATGGLDGSTRGGARVLERRRAEGLHDLERNSIGLLGLSGS